MGLSGELRWDHIDIPVFNTDLIFLQFHCTVTSVSASAESWLSAVNRAREGGLAPGEALYRAAERLGMSTRPMYVQLLLPVAQLEEGTSRCKRNSTF